MIVDNKVLSTIFLKECYIVTKNIAL